MEKEGYVVKKNREGLLEISACNNSTFQNLELKKPKNPPFTGAQDCGLNCPQILGIWNAKRNSKLPPKRFWTIG